MNKVIIKIITVLTINLVLMSHVSAQNIKLENGMWFNGDKFFKQTIWIDDGKLIFKSKGKKIEKGIDLEGKYVIPPFAEAHNHNLESEYQLQKRIDKYLLDGVFYVKLQSAIKKRIAPLMNNFNQPSGLDISLTYAPLTATDGHPIAIRKLYLERGLFGNLFQNLKEIETHGYFNIDNEKDLSEKWESVLSFKPDFIKVMLLYSEEYEKRKVDSAYFGKKGLNPKLLPKIVKLAHKKDLRVSVHVETPTDFHYALASGADEIAHLPGISDGLKISLEDARLASKKNVVVVTTASLVKKRSKDPDYAKLVEAIKYNLKTLKDAGVKLAVGSDNYEDTSLEEIIFLAQTSVFSNLELLKMWTENSAETIFPHRKIGKLKNGFEASFLVLDGNPLEDFGNVQKIAMKVKQGRILK